MKIEQLKGKKIAILWFWKEWKSTLKFLKIIWVEDITILDKNDTVLDWYNIISWDNYLDDLGQYDIIFKTPWISPYHPKIFPYIDKLTSNAEVFFEEYKWKIIWITATKGKSTTSTLMYEVLKEAWYKVKLVGNIWNSIFDEVNILSGEKFDYIVYELSSYMLETLKPHLFIWILWNIYPCHIDWHNNSMDVYVKAKTNLLVNAENIIINEKFVSYLNEDFNWKNIKKFWMDNFESNYYFDDIGFYVDNVLVKYNNNILLEGEHNKYNISSVIWAIDIIWDTNLYEALDDVLSWFEWLPHRQENIWTYNGITFINDSISTTPESTIEAIKRFWNNIGTIFIWGADYWFTDESFNLLKEYLIKYNIENIVLFIETWRRVFWDFSKQMNIWEVKVYKEGEYEANVFMTKSMEEAIKFAYDNTIEWKICILSSASPSFSLWKSYVEKADEFKKYMLEYSKN